MNWLDGILDRARQAPQRIVLSEGEDPRILTAAAQAAAQGIAHIMLVGDPQKISDAAGKHQIALGSVELIDPQGSPLRPQLQQTLYELRNKRGMTPEQAAQAVLHPLTFAALMVRHGHANGSVAGAVYTTADVVRAAIQLIGIRHGASLVSSFFVMLRDEPFHHDVHAMIFSDCGLVIDPSEEQLAEIALAAAHSAEQLLNKEAKVAMLSFSTQGSADHPRVHKVQHATELVRARRPELAIDGEVQLDAAIVPEIAKRKLANSHVHGAANVLVFPNLDAANIGYKLTERLAHATAIGPLLQGLRQPANDLSRGCNANDIYNVIAVTAVQAQTPESAS